jgi:hypothetical protein
MSKEEIAVHIVARAFEHVHADGRYSVRLGLTNALPTGDVYYLPFVEVIQ